MRHAFLLALPALVVIACVGDEGIAARADAGGANVDGGGPVGSDGGTVVDGGAETDSGAGQDSSSGDSGASDSGASDAGADSGPWTPAKLAALALWLDGDSATANVNGTVDTWNDKSSHQNNATTAMASQRPVLLTGVNAVGAHQALRFDGAATFFTITDSASLRWSQSFVMEVVFRHAAAAGQETGPIYNKQTATVLNAPQGPNLVLAALLGSPHAAFIEGEVGPNKFIDTDKSGSGFTSDVPHRVRFAWDSGTTTATLQLDKTTAVTSVIAGVTGLDATGHDAHIGVDPNNFFLKADVAEIVALAGATVTTTDVTLVQAYLDTKYGL
jgi:hypothetical protein